MAADEERRILELARARTRADLHSATVPAHHDMLVRALADIDARIRTLMPHDS